MAAADPLGGQKYWYKGLPFYQVSKSGNDPGTQKFWYQGLANSWLFPTAGVPDTSFVVYTEYPQYIRKRPKVVAY